MVVTQHPKARTSLFHIPYNTEKPCWLRWRTHSESHQNTRQFFFLFRLIVLTIIVKRLREVRINACTSYNTLWMIWTCDMSGNLTILHKIGTIFFMRCCPLSQAKVLGAPYLVTFSLYNKLATSFASWVLMAMPLTNAIRNIPSIKSSLHWQGMQLVQYELMYLVWPFERHKMQLHNHI